MNNHDSINIFWDACVLIRWLTGEPVDFVDDIHQFLQEANREERKIYISTISFAEIRPRYLNQKQYGTVYELIEQFKAALIPISPTPDIMSRSGHLRDIDFKKQKGVRVVGTPDAIQLMTCIHIRDELGVSDIVFHTLDEGKGKNWEGRCVPLIKFEDWCIGNEYDPLVKQVIDLQRIQPSHPHPQLSFKQDV